MRLSVYDMMAAGTCQVENGLHSTVNCCCIQCFKARTLRCYQREYKDFLSPPPIFPLLLHGCIACFYNHLFAIAPS